MSFNLTDKQIEILRELIGNTDIVELVSEDKLVISFSKNIPEEDIRQFLEFLRKQPVSSYTQFLKDTGMIHTYEKLNQYFKSIYQVVIDNKNNPSQKHTLLTEEQKEIIRARSMWNKMVSQCFQDNKEKMAKNENDARARILKKIKALDPDNQNPEQTYERIVSFVAEHTSIVFSFELTPEKLGKIDKYRMLNYFEKTSFTHQGYEGNRNIAEENLFSFFKGKKGINSFSKLAAPRYAALVFLDANNTLDKGVTTTYGKSYAVFSPKIKSQALFYPSDTLNDIVEGIKNEPSVLDFIDIMLSQMDYQRFLNLVLKVEYNQPLDQKLFSIDYIEAHLPSVNLLNGEFVSHIHISKDELSKLPLDFKQTLERNGITVTHDYEGPYQEATKELYSVLKNASKVKAIIKQFPVLLLTANNEGLSPLEKAVELGAIETVEEMLKFKEYISFHQLNRALNIADKKDNKHLVELLIKHGANRNAANLIHDNKSNKNISPKFTDFTSYITYTLSASSDKNKAVQELTSEHKNFILKETNGGIDDIILWMQDYSTNRPKSKIDTKEPIVWAVENDIEVNNVPILLHAVQLYKKLLIETNSPIAFIEVEGQDLIVWALNHDKKLGDSSPLEWAIEHDLPIEKRKPIYWLRSAIKGETKINGQPIIKWAIRNKLKIQNKDFLDWAMEEKLLNGSKMMTYIEEKRNKPKVGGHANNTYMSKQDGISLSYIINGLEVLKGSGAVILRMPAAVWLLIKHPDGKVEKISGANIPNLNNIQKEVDISEQTAREFSQTIYEKYKVNLLKPNEFETYVEESFHHEIDELTLNEDEHINIPRQK